MASHHFLRTLFFAIVLSVGSLCARATVTAEYTGTGPFRGYEVTGASLSSPSLLKVNYYDTYAVLSDNPSDFGGLSYTGLNTYYSDYNRSTCKGRLTASVCAVDGRMDSARVCRTYYYDVRGDLVQQRTGNHLGGTDTESRAYDFRGNCTSLFQTHITPDGDRKQAEYVYSHDSQGRLLKTTVTYGDDMAHVLSDLSYDSLGRLQSESRCGVDELRTEYTYNVRDWLTGIKGTEYTETLHYTESHNGSQPQYGGNISALEWSEAGKSQGYAYTYDGLSRLTGAVHHDASGRTGDYDTSYSYDLQGNVERLTRHGLLDDRSHGVVDDLTYEYDGNQVLKVTDRAKGPYGRKRMHFTDGADAEREYTYDGDGNMVSDLNKGIVSISYNSLNQPMDIVFSDGSRIRYSYASDGTKLSALYHLRLSTSVNGPSSTPDSASRYVDTRRDYCGDMEYEDGEYRRLNYPSGHIEEDDEGTALYFFDLTDHQGNVRASDMADLASDSHNAYYPFGMFLGEENSHGERRWYNGKELDRTHGLDWYDYVARRYDGMRFTTMDPLAEKYYEVSPYAYCGDNPVNAIDENGDSIAILNLGSSCLEEHSALLVQKKGSWYYYSMNGDRIFNSTKGLLGGKPYPDLGEKKFVSPSNFLNSIYNSEGKKEQILNNQRNNYGYKEAYILPTTEKMDEQIIRTFKKRAAMGYHIMNNQCVQVVRKSLESAGMNTPDTYWPNIFFREIQKLYPKGIFIKKNKR